MRRDLFPKERIFFLIVFGCSLLLFSVVMLRGEVNRFLSGLATPSRTFRDGFIVANREDGDFIRRTEINTSIPIVVVEESAKSEKTTKTLGALQVGADGARTTTIKTEDGDEITIKHATSKNQITTISRHHDGKITIENTPASPEPAIEAEAEKEAIVKEKEEINAMVYQDLMVDMAQKESGLKREEEEELENEVTEEEEEVEREGVDQAVIVNGDKVTIVQMNQSLPKSVLDLQEDEVEEQRQENDGHPTSL